MRVVADAINHTIVIIRYQQRAIRQLQHIGRTAPHFAFGAQPAIDEHLAFLHLMLRIKGHAYQLVTDRLLAVPGTVLGNDGIAVVLGRELLAGVKLEADIGAVGLKSRGRERDRLRWGFRLPVRLARITARIIRETEMQADIRRGIELI